MKQRKRLAVLLIVTTILVLSSCSAVFAKKLKLETHTYWAGAPYYYTVFYKNLPEKAKLVSIKSSKPKILEPDKWGDERFDCAVQPLKPGKSKVTVTYKINGKNTSVSGTFTVKKYPKAIKKLVYNGSTIDLKKYKFQIDKYSKTKKITIKATPSKGWKVQNPIELLSEGSSYKTVRNGKSVNIDLKKSRVSALITLKNKKKEVFEYHIDITPEDCE